MVENCEEGGMYQQNKVYPGINKLEVIQKDLFSFSEKLTHERKSWKKIIPVFFLMEKKLLKKDGSSKITKKIKKNSIKEL